MTNIGPWRPEKHRKKISQIDYCKVGGVTLSLTMFWLWNNGSILVTISIMSINNSISSYIQTTLIDSPIFNRQSQSLENSIIVICNAVHWWSRLTSNYCAREKQTRFIRNLFTYLKLSVKIGQNMVKMNREAYENENSFWDKISEEKKTIMHYANQDIYQYCSAR